VKSKGTKTNRFENAEEEEENTETRVMEQLETV
jgi:hypothetical protein